MLCLSYYCPPEMITELTYTQLGGDCQEKKIRNLISSKTSMDVFRSFIDKTWLHDNTRRWICTTILNWGNALTLVTASTLLDSICTMNRHLKVLPRNHRCTTTTWCKASQSWREKEKTASLETQSAFNKSITSAVTVILGSAFGIYVSRFTKNAHSFPQRKLSTYISNQMYGNN